MSAPDYVKALRERRRAAGLVPVEVWVPEADRERVRAYAARLHKRALQKVGAYFPPPPVE